MCLSLFIANLQHFSVKLQLILFKWLYYQPIDIILRAFRCVFTFNVSKNFIFSAFRIKMPNCIIFYLLLTIHITIHPISNWVKIFLQLGKRSSYCEFFFSKKNLNEISNFEKWSVLYIKNSIK